jgi:hypothetical protein
MTQRKSVMIRRYRMSGSMDELMRAVDTQFAHQIEPLDGAHTAAPVVVPPGIVSYQAVRTGPDTLLTITVFETAAYLERAQQGARDIRQSLAAFEVEEIETFSGEVMIGRAGEAMLEPVRP